MPSTKFDTAYFRAGSFDEADNSFGYWKHKSFAERLAAACELIEQVYGPDAKKKMDKTFFSMRKFTYE
jgi:hypothetical protein